MNLSNRVIAVVAGDEREQEIARQAVKTGAEVRAFGFPWPEAGIDGVSRVASLQEALKGADYALFPIPGIAPDGSLFAPEHDSLIIPDGEALSGLNPGAHIILGWADEKLKSAAESSGVTLCEYEHDRELMLLRAPSVVEGALELAIRHTDVSLHRASIAVIGYGNIGRVLTRTLVQLGGRVTVFARNPEQRADAQAVGADSSPLGGLAEYAPRLDMIFSTVPSPVVSEEVLDRLPPDTFLMDLAAPPGGIDQTAAKNRGHRFVWARGMGRRAPITVGRSQWVGISQRIEKVEESR
jgi:dipicolinate synthase subunit A